MTHTHTQIDSSTQNLQESVRGQSGVEAHGDEELVHPTPLLVWDVQYFWFHPGFCSSLYRFAIHVASERLFVMASFLIFTYACMYRIVVTEFAVHEAHVYEKRCRLAGAGRPESHSP